MNNQMVLRKDKLQEFFGYKRPHYTLHALQRFTERLYHVSPDQYKGWMKLNQRMIYYDILVRLSNSVLYKPTEDHLKYIEEKYCNKNLKFLICNNLVFVLIMNDTIDLVTCYLKEKGDFYFIKK
jgi:hypothetical protein